MEAGAHCVLSAVSGRHTSQAWVPSARASYRLMTRSFSLLR